MFSTFRISLFAALVALCGLAQASNESELSEVKAVFNSLQNFSLKDKEVVIFGCGHGQQNVDLERDPGDHSHEGVSCIDINPKSEADFVMDVTKEMMDKDFHHMADVVYFEFLTPGVIYKSVSFANALSLLKPDGLLIWDVYWGLGLPGKPTPADISSKAQRGIRAEIDVLNTKSEFQGLFKLSKEDADLAKFFYCGDNPFNGRKNSNLFMIPVRELDQAKLGQFLKNFRPGEIRNVILSVAEELVKAQVDHDMLEVLARRLVQLAECNPEAANYVYLSYRSKALLRNIKELREGKQRNADVYAWLHKSLIKPNPL